MCACARVCVQRHVSQSSFDKALPILTEIAIPTQATKWTSPDDAAVDTGVKEYLEVSGAADAAAHTTARAATPSRKLSNRAVYYAEDNETLLSISGKFGLDLAALLALNTPLYAGLSPTARLFEDTPIYLKVKPPSAMDAASGDASSSSPTRRTPSATSAASRTHERAWIGTAFLFDTADNDTPGFVANEFGVNHEIVIALNKRRYPGLRRNAQLIENTRLCVPWVPDSKFDLSYCFAHLRPELQVTPLSPIAHVCMFVTGRSDSVRNVAQKLEVDVGEIVALNSNVHAGISKEVCRPVAANSWLLATTASVTLRLLSSVHRPSCCQKRHCLFPPKKCSGNAFWWALFAICVPCAAVDPAAHQLIRDKLHAMHLCAGSMDSTTTRRHVLGCEMNSNDRAIATTKSCCLLADLT